MLVRAQFPKVSVINNSLSLNCWSWFPIDLLSKTLGSGSLVVATVSSTSLLLPIFYEVVVHIPFPFSSMNTSPSSHHKIGVAYKKNGANSIRWGSGFLFASAKQQVQEGLRLRLNLEDSALHVWHTVTIWDFCFFLCSSRLILDCCLFLLLVLKVLSGQLLLSRAVASKLVWEGCFSCPFYIPALNHMWVTSGNFSL